jgi:hypothetical protein
MSKYYHFDYKGNIIAYKTIDELSSLCNEYSSARKGKKMGIVKTDSLEVVVDFIYDRYDNHGSLGTRESISLWEIKNDKKLFQVYLDGKILIIDEKNDVLQSYSYKTIHKENEFIITYLNNLKGVINKNGIVLFEPRFSSCEIISNNRILAKEGNVYFIYDENGELLKSVEANDIRYSSYSENIIKAKFKKNGKEGLFDDDFNVIIENKYDEINVVNDNLIFVRNGNQTTALNKHNEVVKNFDLPFVFYKHVELKNGTSNYVVSEDKSYQAKKGLLNDKFELVLPIEYNWIEYNEDVWVVKKGRSDFLYGMDYKEIKGVKYKEIGEFEPTGISCTVDEEKEGKYRFIDYYGNVINNHVYDKVYLGRNSLLNNLFCNDLLAVSINGKWGYINKSGNLLTEIIYEEATEFDSRGFAIVKLNGKWGIINKMGESVILPLYEQILKLDQNDNVILKQNSKWGVINTKGEIVIDFCYESIYNYNLEHKVIKSKKDNLFGLVDFNNEIIIPHLADSLWLEDGYVDVETKKGVFQKSKIEKKSSSFVKEKVKLNKVAEPILLLEKKYIKYFDTLKHPDILRVAVIAVAEESSEGFFKIYIIDFVMRDNTTASYINGYTGGGVWESYEFNNDVTRDKKGISAFHLAHNDLGIKNLLKGYLCEYFDDEADEYRYESLDLFAKVGVDNLMVLNGVWYEKGYDYSSISKNDKKRFKNILKQCDGLFWNKWNFKF